MARLLTGRHVIGQLPILALVLVATALTACTTRSPLPAPPGAANPAYRASCEGDCVPAPDTEGHMLGDDLLGVLRDAKTPDAVGKIWLRLSDEPVGTVLAQVPWPGEPMRRRSGLTLVLSGGPVAGSATIDWCDATTRNRCDPNGPTQETMKIIEHAYRIPGERVRVPRVGGLSHEQAARVLTRSHFYYRVVAVGGTDDLVLSQRPRAGTTAHARSEVVIRVTCDAIPVDLPDGAYLYDPCSGGMDVFGIS